MVEINSELVNDNGTAEVMFEEILQRPQEFASDCADAYRVLELVVNETLTRGTTPKITKLQTECEGM